MTTGTSSIENSIKETFYGWMDGRMPIFRDVVEYIYSIMCPVISTEKHVQIISIFRKTHREYCAYLEEDLQRARSQKSKDRLSRKLQKANAIYEYVTSPAMKNGLLNQVRKSLRICDSVM